MTNQIFEDKMLTYFKSFLDLSLPSLTDARGIKSINIGNDYIGITITKNACVDGYFTRDDCTIDACDKNTCIRVFYISNFCF